MSDKPIVSSCNSATKIISRNKLAKTRYILEMVRNRPTLNHHCTNKCLNRKCPTCPNIPTRHQFRSTTLETTHTTKCNYTCKSTGIAYLVTCKRCHKQYVSQTLGSLHTWLKENESRCETQHLSRINNTSRHQQCLTYQILLQITNPLTNLRRL